MNFNIIVLIIVTLIIASGCVYYFVIRPLIKPEDTIITPSPPTPSPTPTPTPTPTQAPA